MRRNTSWGFFHKQSLEERPGLPQRGCPAGPAGLPPRPGQPPRACRAAGAAWPRSVEGRGSGSSPRTAAAAAAAAPPAAVPLAGKAGSTAPRPVPSRPD